MSVALGHLHTTIGVIVTGEQGGSFASLKETPGQDWEGDVFSAKLACPMALSEFLLIFGTRHYPTDIPRLFHQTVHFAPLLRCFCRSLLLTHWLLNLVSENG